jgi:LmbE family N-acetylglucosaminyl deacetylase
MQLSQPSSEVYVWDGAPEVEALARTTHLGICAHQDDLEILALHGILECFHRPRMGFSGVVVTDGAGSARDFEFAACSDEQMKAVRRIEQKKAAHVGEYAALVLLDHTSRTVKNPDETSIVEDLTRVLEATKPEVVYTHNLADKHDTHVAVALRTIAALRALPSALRPKKVIGCEVWRDLDWLADEVKVALDVSRHEHLQAALLGVFHSQIAGGKRYDLATLGRRRAHATFSESHDVDAHQGLVYGMDLTPLLAHSSLEPTQYAASLIERFQSDVVQRMKKLA